MKKLLSLFICICLTICTITAPVMAEDSEIPARVSGLLSAIGVMRPEDTTNTGMTLSRGQFAVYAARLAGDRFIGESNKYYTDIPEASFCYNEVSTLVNLGALSVPEDKMFNPNNAVTYSEACKILMCVLGFKDYAEAKGGYPVGYEYMVKQSDINMGLDGTEMNLKNAMQMIYNACHVKLLDVSSIKNSYISWVPGQETILSITRDIYCVEGRIDKTDIVSLIDKTPLKDGLVEISGVSVYAAKTGIEKDLGHYVDAYYLKDTADKPGTMVYYYDKSETTTIDIDDFQKYDNGVLSYADEKADKIKTLNIGTDVPILLNGLRVRNDVSDAFNNTTYGHIEITYYNNEIVLVHIRRMETLVIKYTDELTKSVWDEYRSNTYFNADESKMDKLSIYDAVSGTKINYSSLQAGYVLNIYRSTDGKVAEAYLSTAYITGTVTEIKDDEIFIDGVAYKINKELKPYLDINVGMNATFCLDANGAICVSVIVMDQNQLAYIYDVGSDKSPFSPTIKLKVFMATSEHKVLDVKVPVIIDGERKEAADDVLNALAATGDMDTYRQPIRVSLNSDGTVKSIDTAAASKEDREEDGTLVTVKKYTGAETQLYYTSAAIAFFPDPILSRHTKVLVVPEETVDNPNEDNFRSTNKDFFTETLMFKVSAYKVDYSHPFADVVIVRRAKVGKIDETAKPIMVDEVYEKLDKNGKPVKVISGLQLALAYEGECADDIDFYSIDTSYNNKPYTQSAISSVDDLERGDLIRVATDVDGRICEIQVLYDFAENQPPYWCGRGQYADQPGELRTVNNKFTLTFGHVVDKWVDKDRTWDTFTADRPGPVLHIGYTDTATIDRSICMGNSLSSIISVYDIEKDKVFQGTWDDIIGYDSGYGGSDVIIVSNYIAPKGVMVYRY